MDDRTYLKKAGLAAPPAPYVRNAALAFLGGGMIALVGQVVSQYFTAIGFTEADAAAPTSVVMVFLAAVFTALGLYDRLVRWAGMGASLPITGFANAVVAPAMEFRREGLVMGTGARMFQLAGPVLAFGLLTSFVAGLVLFIMTKVRG